MANSEEVVVSDLWLAVCKKMKESPYSFEIKKDIDLSKVEDKDTGLCFNILEDNYLGLILHGVYFEHSNIKSGLSDEEICLLRDSLEFLISYQRGELVKTNLEKLSVLYVEEEE